MDKEKANELKERISNAAQGQKLPCEKAFAIASELNCDVSDVGKTCNESGIKIIGCQLGCF